jgi:large subunit ribosomal protein L35
MPKQKTHKGLKNRVSVTATGKVKFRKSGSSHRNSVSSGAKKRQRRGMAYATSGDIKRLELALRRPLRPASR